MSKEEKPTSLSTMLGNGGNFNAKDKSYTIKPIALQDIESFMTDNLSLGAQLFNVADKKARAKVDRWLGGTKDKDGNIVDKGYCFDESNNPVPLEKAMKDGWDVVDLKEFFKKLCDFSG